MKNIFTLAFALFFVGSLRAQAPEKMSYQAVVRDGSNELVTNQSVGMRISILQGSVNDPAVYVETQTLTTNSNGLVSLEIGSGTSVLGTFNGIDWSTGLCFIKTETDPTGGSTYTITGTSQLMSVPFALYAKTSGNGKGVDGIDGIDGVDGQDGQGGIITAGTNVTITGSGTVGAPYVVNSTLTELDGSVTNEIQQLSVSLLGDTLLLQNGGHVIIPGISLANSPIYDADGNIYTSEIFGTQEWLTENLRTTKYSDGTVITNATDNNAWANLSWGEGAWSYYDNESGYNSDYGKLYNAYTVMEGQVNICPIDWHVPTDAEWSILTDYLAANGYTGKEGSALKSTYGSYWIDKSDGTSGGGIDFAYEWKGLPGGSRNFNGSFDNNIASAGVWWSSTVINNTSAWSRSLDYSYDYVSRNDSDEKSGFSVRCLRD